MTESATQKSFSLLVAAAFADGSLTDVERAVLSRKAAEMRLPADRVQQMILQAEQGKLRLSYPQTVEERNRRLDDLLDILCADGRIEGQERQFMLRYTTLIGGPPEDLNERVRLRMRRAQAQTSPGPVVPPPPPIVPAGAPSAEPPPPGPLRDASPPGNPMLRPSFKLDEHHDESGPVQMTPSGPSRNASAPGNPMLRPSFKLDEHHVESGPVLMTPPGPIQLPGPCLGAPMSELPPITLALLRQVIEFDGKEEGVAYLQRACLMNPDPARQLVEKVLATHPDIKPRSRRIQGRL